VLLWTITFGLLVAAAILTLRRDAWVRPVVSFVAAGIAFQILTLVQPPLAIGAVVVGVVALLLCWPVRSPARTNANAVAQRLLIGRS
jgi:hypothetical protein